MDARLPTRLIYVADEHNDPQLCITRDSGLDNSAVKYAALTHCWGSIEEFVTTTRDNLEQMLHRIPLSMLTKTFKDAITITRRLGLQYLWIDSLCILQGDQDDWIRESATMANVYSGCTVNIVAAGAPNGSIGCLFRRDQSPEYGFKAYVRSEASMKTRELWNFSPEGPGEGCTGDRACKLIHVEPHLYSPGRC